jgi:hypothetical protein
MSKLYRVEIDYENAACKFWDSVSQRSKYKAYKYHELSVKLSALGWQTDHIVLTACEILQLRSMPFWHDGPSYAEHPVLIFEIGNDHV